MNSISNLVVLRSGAVVSAVLSLAGASLLWSAPVSDSYVLQPGWNAVFIEVEPTDPSPAAVFNHPAIKQVWSRIESGSPVQFISDPAEADWNTAAGRRYVPAGRPEAVVTDLFAILGHRAYLVEVDGSSPVNLTVTGEPSRRSTPWQGQSYNLSGLSLDPAEPISLGDYFLPSAAHAGQKIYQLGAGGRWTEAAPSTIAGPGKAYWVFATQGSEYRAPLEVVREFEQGFLYAGEITEADVTLKNTTSAPMSVTLENVDALPLVHAQYDATQGTLWPGLSSHSLTLAAGETRVVTVGIRRSQLSNQTGGTVTITGGGCRFRVPVIIGEEIEAVIASMNAEPAAGSPAPSPAPPATSPYTGLWLGQVLVNKVAFVNDAVPANRTTPVNTATSFPLRVLLHFDAAGNAKLLGQVTILKKGQGADEEFVLVTNDTLIPSFAGASLVDGEEFGYRISALGFDTVSGTGIAMSGSLETGLSATLTTAKSDPVHPYKHRYHPDHDGLDAQYQPQAANLSPILEEVWIITRTVTLTVAAPTLDATQPPGAGDSILEGSYSEQVTGMHRETIRSSGSLSLQRLVKIPVLNPQP